MSERTEWVYLLHWLIFTLALVGLALCIEIDFRPGVFVCFMMALSDYFWLQMKLARVSGVTHKEKK